MMGDILQQTDHRPWPLPNGPWVMAQSWHDLLFAHWPISPIVMRGLMPPQLEVDTFEGDAWVGVVPFRMSGVRPRLTPALPWLSAFPELNVRTYVKVRDRGLVKTGVYFFSLEAANPVAVAVARSLYKLPYFRAQMRLIDDGQQIHYRSKRTHAGAPPAQFQGDYAPTGFVFRATPGSIEAWLTERYSLYTVHRGQVYIGEIHHLPWPLQPAAAEIQHNSMTSASQIYLPAQLPLLHFARQLDVVVWQLRRIAEDGGGSGEPRIE